MEAVQAGARSAPWAPAVVCGTAAAVVFGAGVAGGVHGATLLVTPVSVALLGVVLLVQRRLDAFRARSSADAWIARGYDSPRSRYGWRVAELTSRRERRRLAHSLRRTAEQADAGPSLLVAIADRLADTSRPISACGALAVERLVADGSHIQLAEILDRLEVRR